MLKKRNPETPTRKNKMLSSKGSAVLFNSDVYEMSLYHSTYQKVKYSEVSPSFDKILQNRILYISIKVLLISHCRLCSGSVWTEGCTISTPKCKCCGIAQHPDYASTGKRRNWKALGRKGRKLYYEEKYSAQKSYFDGILLLVAMRSLLCQGTVPKYPGPLWGLLYMESC